MGAAHQGAEAPGGLALLLCNVLEKSGNWERPTHQGAEDPGGLAIVQGTGELMQRAIPCRPSTGGGFEGAVEVCTGIKLGHMNPGAARVSTEHLLLVSHALNIGLRCIRHSH